MKIYVISRVTGTGEQYRKMLEEYVEMMEKRGHKVHLPHRDTNQSLSSFEVCKANCAVIREADLVVVFYDEESKGSHFDLGMAFTLNKPIVALAYGGIEIMVMPKVKKCDLGFMSMINDWRLHNPKLNRWKTGFYT